jgi:hypothetical protein
MAIDIRKTDYKSLLNGRVLDRVGFGCRTKIAIRSAAPVGKKAAVVESGFHCSVANLCSTVLRFVSSFFFICILCPMSTCINLVLINNYLKMV